MREAAPLVTAKQVVVVANDRELLALLDKREHEWRRVHAEQGDAHWDIDDRLIRPIDEVLKPLLGPWDISGSCWYHELDVYGAGIRHLEFRPGAFPQNAIDSLQALLVGEHEHFGILCWTEQDLRANEPEGLLIFANSIFVTPGLRAVAHG